MSGVRKILPFKRSACAAGVLSTISHRISSARSSALTIVLLLAAVSGTTKAQILSNSWTVQLSDTSFTLEVPGTDDSYNSRKYRQESIFDLQSQLKLSGVENTISLSLENRGSREIVNPRVVINGKGLLYSFADWIGEIPLSGLSTIDDTIKTLQCYITDNYYHWLVSTKPSQWNISPLKTFVSFGAGQCDNVSQVFVSLLRALGYPNARARVIADDSHTIGVVTLNDGRTVSFDADIRVFYPSRGNDRLATYDELCDDQDLVRRQHHYGFGSSLFKYDDDLARMYSRYLPSSDRVWGEEDSVSLVLRPSEKIDFLFTRPPGKYHQFLHAYSQYNLNPPEAPPTDCLGTQTYEPPISLQLFQFLQDTVNLSIKASGENAELVPTDSSRSCGLTVQLSSPFAITNGKIHFRYERNGADSVSFLIVEMSKYSNTAFRTIYRSNDNSFGSIDDSVDLYSIIQPVGTPMLDRYYVRFTLGSSISGGIGLSKIRFSHDFQFNPNAVPRLAAGINHLAVSSNDGNPFDSLVVSAQYCRIDSLLVPPVVSQPVYPHDGDSVSSSMDFLFRWEPPTSSLISDYQIQVSERPDFRFPVSSAFDNFTSQGASFAGTATWRAPFPGMLKSGSRYYWRVAAKSVDGIWSEWSPTWSFVVAGPGLIQNGQVETQGDSVAIVWSPGLIGSPPSSYVVLASATSGFSLSTGVVLDTITTCSYTISGQNRLLNFPYYRIVALDGLGRNSGLSSQIIVSVPRVFVKPIPLVQVGDSICLDVKTITSRFEYGHGPLTPVCAHTDSLALNLDQNGGGYHLDGSEIRGRVTSTDTVLAVKAISTQTGADYSRKFVLRVNHRPAIAQVPALIAAEDSGFTYSIACVDSDNDPIRYTFVGLPKWIQADSVSGTVRGIPSGADVGVHSFEISARDGRGGNATQSVSITVLHTNHAPVISGLRTIYATEDSALVARFRAIDPDSLFNDRLLYRFEFSPTWLSIDSAAGTIRGIPRGANVGDTSFAIEVSDNNGALSRTTALVQVRHTNHRPLFDRDHLWSISALEDGLLSVHLHATDPDSKTFGDYVLYSLLSAPHWLGIDSMTGVLHGTPGLKDGDTAVSVLATDGLLSDTLTLSVSVVHPPHPPVALGIPPVELSHGEVTQVPLTSYFKDQENPLSSLKWSLKTSTTDMRLSNADTSGSGASYPFLPDTANNGVGSSGIRVVMRLVGQRGYRDSLIARIDSATMALRCRPPVTLGGFQTAVVISAMSSSSIGAKDTVLIVVPTSTVPPKITGGMALSFDEDDSVRVSPSALLRYVVAPNDPDSALHWSIRSDGIILVSSDTTGIVLRSRRNWNGVDSVRLVVANDRGLGDSIMMSVRVRPVNDPPASTTISRLAFEEDSCITVSLDTLVIDPDNGAREITWGIGNSPQGITLFRRSGLDTIRVPISDSRMPSPSGTLVCTLDSSGTRLRLTASRRFFGSSIAFYLKAIDTGGLSCIDSMKLDIRQRNYPPLLASPSILTMKEDAGTSISLRSIYHLLIDPDDSASTHRWCVRNGRHVHPVVVDSTIVFSADSLWFGADTLTLVATDPGGLSDSTQWIMNVQWVNHPPRFERLPDTLATMNVRYRWRPVVHDPDPNDVEIVTIENGPDWLGVDTTGTLSGVAHKSGSWTVAVAVHDRSGATDTLSFVLQSVMKLTVTDMDAGLPSDFILYQNYPNPFNPSTTMRFGLPERSALDIRVYSALGQVVEQLFHGTVEAGYHEKVWLPRALASGAYFVVFDAVSQSHPGRVFHSVRRALYVK